MRFYHRRRYNAGRRASKPDPSSVLKERLLERRRQWEEFHRWEAEQPPWERPVAEILEDLGAIWNWFPEEEKTTDFYSITDLRDEHPDWFREDLEILFALAIEGKIVPQVWKVMPMSEAAAAHRYI